MLDLAAAAVVLARLARGRRRRPPLAPHGPPEATISAVVPARNEAGRIGPCLEGLRADPDLHEVIVVDDCSADGTAELARRLGARVVEGREPPPGWIGKPWALQQGLEAARGEIVVSVDADTRPRPGLARALAAALDHADLVTGGCRFVCDTAGERWLHPSLLTTLVYRFGPPDANAAAAATSGRPPAVELDGEEWYRSRHQTGLVLEGGAALLILMRERLILSAYGLGEDEFERLRAALRLSP
jgi:glycosyltransferase involved in cell wall biosynthesis